jgi:acyl carrier protein
LIEKGEGMNQKMQRDEVVNKVIEVVAEVFATDEKELSMETKFVDDLDAASLDIITLLMEFEDLFDKKIPEEDAVKLQTIGDAVDYIISITENPS